MKQKISIILHLFLLLALSACGLTKPSPTATTQPSRLPDPEELKATGTWVRFEAKYDLVKFPEITHI